MATNQPNTLPIIQTTNQDLMLLETKWAAILNPLLRNQNKLNLATSESINDSIQWDGSSVTLFNVKGSSLNISTTGNAVLISLQPITVATSFIFSQVGGIEWNYGQPTVGVPLLAEGIIAVLRDNTPIKSYAYVYNTTSTTNTANATIVAISPSIEFIDFQAPAGSHTYSLQWTAVGTNPFADITLEIANMQLVAVEL